jgi:hypothetical protein
MAVSCHAHNRVLAGDAHSWAFCEREAAVSGLRNVAYHSCLGHGFGAARKRVASFCFPPFAYSALAGSWLETNSLRRENPARDPAPKSTTNMDAVVPVQTRATNPSSYPLSWSCCLPRRWRLANQLRPPRRAKGPQRPFLAIIHLILP